MSEKKKPAAKRPEKVIRKGSVAAEIYLKQSPDGFRYHDFALVRTFRNGGEKELRSGSFFYDSVNDLTEAAREAGEWIEGQRVPAREQALASKRHPHA